MSYAPDRQTDKHTHTDSNIVPTSTNRVSVDNYEQIPVWTEHITGFTTVRYMSMMLILGLDLGLKDKIYGHEKNGIGINCQVTLVCQCFAEGVNSVPLLER